MEAQEAASRCGTPVVQQAPEEVSVERRQLSQVDASDRLVWEAAEELPLVCARLFRLFFPLTLLRASRGWLIGWALRDGTAVACGVLPQMPPRLVGAFLDQLNARLLKPNGNRVSSTDCNSSSNSSSNNCNDSNNSSNKDYEGPLVLDHRVVPQAVELLGWWRGAECQAACPYQETAVLQQVLHAKQQQKQQQQQQQGQPATGIGSEPRRGAWLDICLGETTGLPVPLRVVSHAEAAAAATAPAGASAASRVDSPDETTGADAAAGEGPPATTVRTVAGSRHAVPASSRCIVFLFNLPSWVGCSTLAAAPHDAAQASAAAAFVQRPAAARALLRQAAQGQGTAGQHQLQQQQQEEEQWSSSTDPLCGFEAVLALLNVSAAVYCSTQQQLERWRDLQLRQQTAAAAAAAEDLHKDSSSYDILCSSGSSGGQQHREQQWQRDGRHLLQRWLFTSVSCLSRFVCCLFFSLISFCGNLSRSICRMHLWRPFAVASGMWCLVASIQQMVLRLQTLAAWPAALSSMQTFTGALRAVIRREKQQQQQQVDAAAAAGELQLAAANVPPLLPCQPLLKRTYLPRAFSLSALCLYGGIVAILVDLLLGLFLPQLLAMLIYHVIPSDACSSFSLSPSRQPPPEPPLPPLFPISLRETAPPRLYPDSHQPQRQQSEQVQLSLHDAQPQHHQPRCQLHHQQPQQQDLPLQSSAADHKKKGSRSRGEGKCRKGRGPRRGPMCSRPATAPVSTSVAATVAGVSRTHPSWRELMVQPTSSVLVDLFSACYCFLHVHLLTSHVHWLMDFPAGLKLNVNLTRVLGSVILTVIHLWNDLTSYLHSAIIYAEHIKWGIYEKLDIADVAKTRGVLSGLMLLNALKKAAVSGLRNLYALLASSPTPLSPATLAAPPSNASKGHDNDPRNEGTRKNHKNTDLRSGGSIAQGGVWAMWTEFLARALWLWDSCRLCLKGGLGTLLTTFRLGWLGLSASMFVAASADLLMVVTLHIFYVYLVCARLLHVNLKSLHSLFLLFR